MGVLFYLELSASALVVAAFFVLDIFYPYTVKGRAGCHSPFVF
jgi:hypothetical protein